MGLLDTEYTRCLGGNKSIVFYFPMAPVSTEEQLYEAIANGVSEIRIEGKLCWNFRGHREFSRPPADSILKVAILLQVLAMGGLVTGVVTLKWFLFLCFAIFLLMFAYIRASRVDIYEVSFDSGSPWTVVLRRKPTK